MSVARSGSRSVVPGFQVSRPSLMFFRISQSWVAYASAESRLATLAVVAMIMVSGLEEGDEVSVGAGTAVGTSVSVGGAVVGSGVDVGWQAARAILTTMTRLVKRNNCWCFMTFSSLLELDSDAIFKRPDQKLILVLPPFFSLQCQYFWNSLIIRSKKRVSSRFRLDLVNQIDLGTYKTSRT